MAQNPARAIGPLHPTTSTRDPANHVTFAIGLTIRLVVAAGLAADAWIHLDLANTYDVVKAQISQGTLFRLESTAAAATAFLVIVIHHRITHALAFVVAASAVTVLLINTYTHVGAIGPFPDMYEPTWFGQKTLALAMESTAVAASLLGIAFETHRRKTTDA